MRVPQLHSARVSPRASPRGDYAPPPTAVKRSLAQCLAVVTIAAVVAAGLDALRAARPVPPASAQASDTPAWRLFAEPPFAASLSTPRDARALGALEFGTGALGLVLLAFGALQPLIKARSRGPAGSGAALDATPPVAERPARPARRRERVPPPARLRLADVPARDAAAPTPPGRTPPAPEPGVPPAAPAALALREQVRRDPRLAARALRAWLGPGPFAEGQPPGDDGRSEGGVDGATRAALVLISLGEGLAAEVLRHLGPEEILRAGVAMTAPEGLPGQALEPTLDDFERRLAGQARFGSGAEDYLRRVLVEALGEDKAGPLLERIVLGGRSRGLEALKWMDARSIHALLGAEHPQAVAIVLACLDPAQAAEVLGHFPEPQQAELVLRVATLDGVQPGALQELEAWLEQQLRGAGLGECSSPLGGLRTAAGILDRLGGGADNAVLARLEQAAPDTARQLEELMFVFDDLALLEDRAVEGLLREVPLERVELALRAAGEGVREVLARNLPPRAAAQLRAALERPVPVRLSDIELAQRELLGLARRLVDQGRPEAGGPRAAARASRP